MKTLSIFQKLIGSYLLVGIITVITISVFFYQGFKKALIDRTLAQLSSVNILKKEQIEEHFKSRARNLNTLVKNPIVLNSFLKPDSLLAKELNRIAYENNYQSIFLIDNNLQLISLLSPELNSSANSNAFLANCLKDFCIYDASYDTKKTQLFLGRPIEDDKRKVIGAIIIQEDYAFIEQILNERTGMGNTGETYLVAPNGYMRSISRFFPAKNPLNIQVKTIATKNVANGKEGSGIIYDYRNVPVLSAYRNLLAPGFKWTIISEMDFEEAMTPVYQVRDYIEIIGLLITVLIILVTIVLAKTISTPILKLKETALMLSKGILPQRTLELKNEDEVGQMANAINQLVAGLKSTSNFANEIGNGNLSVHFTPLSNEDILGKNLIQMRDKLIKSAEQEKNSSLQRTSALLEGQENERLRIAQELHDGIGQLLTATKFRVGAIEGQEELQRELKDVLDETITEVRRISNNLMPSVLIDFGLEAGMRLLCNNAAKYSPIPIRFVFNNQTNKDLNFEISIGLYRIAQEGINNIIKYSEATNAELSINLEDKLVAMELKDNGKGFDIENYLREQRKESNGIRNMKERVKLLRGEFYITSAPGKGVAINIEIHLSN